MRWNEIVESAPIMDKPAKPEPSAFIKNIPVHKGPIIGIPITEMEAWEDAQNNGVDLPEPKARKIE